MKAQDIDLLDPTPFAEDREHELYALLRRDDPVHWNPEPGGQGFWALTRYAEVSEVLKRPTLFISGKGTQIPDKRAEGKGRPSLHNADPPEHTELRAAVNPAFRSRRLKHWEAPVRAIVGDLLDRVDPGEPFDFVDQVAVPLPMTVLGKLLGVEEPMWPKLVEWTNAMTGSDEAVQKAARTELFEHYRGLAAARREDPQDDLTSVLVHGRFTGGRQLDQEQLDAYFVLLTIAGNETTRNLLSGSFHELCQRPEAYAWLREDPSRLDVAIEEFVRWVSPVIHMRRTATEDTALDGTPIAAGDKLVLFFAAANRDETAFERADELVLDRHPNPHLGFGQGIHFCLGAHLARLEVKVFYEELMKRYDTLERLAPATRVPSNWFRGVSALPARVA
jgi:cytochrome P450